MLLLLVALAGSGILPLGVPDHAAPPGPISVETSNNFDQLVVVLMENRNLNEVYGPATYMTQLADTFAFSTGWTSITNPSQPNYIALIGGSTFGVSGDGNHPNLNHPTIVDIMENTSKTWKAFAEDASGTGCGLNPPRGEDHFPFLSFTTITGGTSITNPSQPNYIALIGGSTFGVSGDGNHPNLNHPTIVDIMENTSKTWKAFAEDASGTGCGLNPPRGEDHFPFLSFTTIT